MHLLSIAARLFLCSSLLFGLDARQERADEAPHLLSTEEQWVIRVVDRYEEVPVVGASVWSSYTIGNESFPLPDATTNVHGEAAIDLRKVRELRPIEQASVEIDAYVACEGYSTAWTTTQADHYEWEETLDDLDICSEVLLFRGRSLTGRILDDTGAPVHGAAVVAGVWDEAAGEWRESLDSGCYLSRTEPGGHFSFDLEAAKVRELYSCHHRAGAGSMSLSPTEIKELRSGEFELTLTRVALTLRGKATGSDGRPLRRARLYARHEGDPPTPFPCGFEVPVADDGGFEIACPAPGSWSFETGWVDWLHAAPGPEPVQLAFPESYAVIRVVDEEGRPVRSFFPYVQSLVSTPTGLDAARHVQVGEERHWNFHPMPEGTGGGGWICKLGRAGSYTVSRRLNSRGRAWFGETILEVAPNAAVTEATLVLEELALADAIEIEFLDARGSVVPEWWGSLRSVMTGLELDTITNEGRIHVIHGEAHYHELRYLAGTYRLRLGPDQTGYALPVESEITVRADLPNELTLRSPGFGGRLFLLPAGGEVRRRVDPEIVLTHLSTGRHFGPSHLWCWKGGNEIGWESSFPVGFKPGLNLRRDPSRLLEPGEWAWRILEKGEELAAGTVHIRAEQDTTIEVDFGG